MIAETLIALAAVNVACCALFGWDKYCAAKGVWRVPESTLLAFALIGGTPGAFAGRALFRHKTRKQPFVGQLYGIVGLQAAGLALAGWYLLLR
ncbi:DUF1294 domain-containing protein [Oricola cellulosilytica]|uniref:DUF1294 domain-containing protein n=1 Tax=Oricola cellulosilytica TaxID=1429082 RepID=A0A4R0PEC3_9HYPH|nr:DUF1294 domain-containing protein [Oricola cellulosilytica]TCD16147.1 DUF1294 domain-containing protein [Oricola cellulosilytica]